MSTLAVLQTKQKSVIMLEFSRDGRLLISFGEDKTVVISDWKSNTIISTTKGNNITHIIIILSLILSFIVDTNAIV